MTGILIKREIGTQAITEGKLCEDTGRRQPFTS